MFIKQTLLLEKFESPKDQFTGLIPVTLQLLKFTQANKNRHPYQDVDAGGGTTVCKVLTLTGYKLAPPSVVIELSVIKTDEFLLFRRSEK